jgi:hypothetical protein
MLTRPTILYLTAMLACTSSCTQPEMNCTSAHGEFAAEYTLTDGDPASPCAQLPGDVLGLQSYYQPGGLNGTPNYQKAKLAIRPKRLGELIAQAEKTEVIKGAEVDETFYAANAIASFTTGFPDDDSFCRAEDFTTVEVSLPDLPALPDDPDTTDIDESRPAHSAFTVAYRWSNARVVVSPDAQGTQFEADLEYQEDDCTAQYHVVGLYPAVGCKNDDECNDEHNKINPDFAVRCNTDLGLCVLNAELPAYEE